MTLEEILLTLRVQAKGNDALTPVVSSLEELSSATDDVKKRAAGLFEEFSSADKAQRAITQFRETGRSVLDLATRIDAAKAKVASLGKELSATEAPTKRQVAAFDAARDALRRLEAADDRQRAKLGELRQALQAQGLETTNLVKAESTLAQRRQQSVASLQAEVSAYKAASAEAARKASAQRDEEQAALRSVKANTSAAEALRKYQAGARDASAGNEQLAASTGRLGGVFSSLKGAAAGVLGFLTFRSAIDGVKNILGLGDAAEKTRIRLASLFGSQAAGDEAFAKIKAIARENGQALDATLKSAAKLKTFGIDPLNGSLQAVIDQNAKLGGSQENLEGIVLALGQAYAKQKLQGEEILQLVERGVPVWDLLSKATGKNVLELQKLSEQGRLGRDVIAQLIAEIGKSSSGAAAASLGTLSGLTAQLKNGFDEFLTIVADSGALEFFKKQLQGLLAEIKRLQENGDLKQYAINVSDAIVSASSALKSGIVFIFDHAKAIASLALAYAGFKTATFVANIATAAQSLLSASNAASAASTAVSGASGAMSLFGRALAAIRANPVILAIAAAATFTTGKLLELADALRENAAAQELLQQAEDDARSAKAELVSRIATLIESNKQYADTQIKTGDEVRRLSAVEATEYQQRLERARQYYSALATQAKLANDQVGLADAKARLAEIQSALAGVQSSLASLEEAARNATGRFGEFATTQAAKFDELAAKGDGAAKAVKGLFESLDLTTPKGLADASQLLETVSARGKEAGAAIRDELRKQILEMSDNDFANFERSAAKAFAAGGNGAKLMQDAVRGVNLQRLGVDVEAIRNGFTTAGAAAIDTFRKASDEVTTLGLNADQQSAAMSQAFIAAFAKASTSTELETLKVEIGKTFDQGKISLQEYEKQIDQVNSKLADITKKPSAPPSEPMQQYTKEATKAAEATAELANAADDMQSRGGGALNALADHMAKVRSEFSAISEGAALAFDSVVADLDRVRTSIGAGLGFDTVREEFATAADQIRAEVEGQRSLLQQQIQMLGTMGEAGAGAFRVTAENAALVSAKLDTLAQQIQDGTTSFTLLGAQELQPLQQALESARQRVEALQQQAQQAREELSGMASDLQDQLDQINGDKRSIENRRFDEQLKQIDELAKKSGVAGAAEAAQARARAEELHRLKLQQIADEEKARASSKDRDAQGAGGGRGGSSGSSASSGGWLGGTSGSAGTSQPSGGGTSSGGSAQVNVNVQGSVIGAGSKEALAESLARLIRPELQRIERRIG